MREGSENYDKQKLVILGTGKFAEEVADLISEIDSFELTAFIEPIDKEKSGRNLLGFEVLSIEEIKELDESYRGVCAIGSPERKMVIERAIDLDLRFMSVVHPAAHVSPSAVLGNGSILCAGAVIAAQTNIGSHTIVNRGSLIGHHVTIGAYATISPGANIAGRTSIGESVFIGMGAIILDGKTVGHKSIVGAGSMVTKDVPSGVKVVGVPARKVGS